MGQKPGNGCHIGLGVDGLQTTKHRARLPKAIEKADTLWACKVDGYPTKEAEQRKDLRYVYGYEVKNVHPLLAAEVTAVKAALLDSLTFDTAAVKSCPMVAQYAIAVRQGGKMPLALVISTAPCGKALLFDKQHADKPTSMELRLGNKLEAVVAGLW
ncbi:MAG: hypothetical protein IPP17_13625 [Bacteroidetes bacterium]|nr:hypothetical protein [Bacteroidota bacterium]